MYCKGWQPKPSNKGLGTPPTGGSGASKPTKKIVVEVIIKKEK